MRWARRLFLFAAMLPAIPAVAQRFFPDDPVERLPKPLPVELAQYRSLNDLYELATNTFKKPGERHPSQGVVSALAVNTRGEVLDSAWFENRHGRHRMSQDELRRGSGNRNPPSLERPWQVLAVKRFSERPGLLIRDKDNHRFLLRFDSRGYPEVSTGAAMVGSRILHALGYHTPEKYLVHFQKAQLRIAEEGISVNAVGQQVRLLEEELELFLKAVATEGREGYRAVAIRVPDAARILGPTQTYGTRSDDPNDVFAHEHRRDLRGLYLISAWLGNNWFSAVQMMDILVDVERVPIIRHLMVDTFSMLGSGFRTVKDAREGNEPMFDLRKAAKNFITFGLHPEPWQRAHYPDIRGVGLFESKAFDPARWTPNYWPAPLANHLPDDDYWAAKQIAAFSDEDIRTIAAIGEYSDPKAAEWIAQCLIERRDKVVKHGFSRVLPLEDFRVESGELKHADLGERRSLWKPKRYVAQWSEFRNQTREHVEIPGDGSLRVPQRVMAGHPGSYWAAKVGGDTPGLSVTVYLRKESTGFQVVGIDHDWPGKVVIDEKQAAGLVSSRYLDLTPRQRELIDGLTAAYNATTGFGLKPAEYFQSLSVSERTTFEAITDALTKTEMTEASGAAIGLAIDVIERVDRVAGQYFGREGDQQFRLFVTLKPDAVERLEKSKQFFLSHENTVFHAGYPHSYRQDGKEPNLQFSVSEDGRKADIDIDYRSARIPQAMWDGHLTAANSDVRAGENYGKHTSRWSGLVNWWTILLGALPESQSDHGELMALKDFDKMTPHPDNRPPGYGHTELYDAAQEFLTDWLVRRTYDEAMHFVSLEVKSCSNKDESAQFETLTPDEARRYLREIMKRTVERAGKRQSLSQTIDPVKPWRKGLKVISHPFENEFAIAEIPDAVAKIGTCESHAELRRQRAYEDPNAKYGTYFATIFHLKSPGERGPVLGLVWTRQGADWRIITWKVFEM